MTSSQGWHPEQIKAAIRQTGVSCRDVAVDAGLHPSALSQALRRPIPAANRAIADYLGKALHELWPAWFDEDGEPLPFGRKRSTPASEPQRKNRSAA